MLASNYDKHIEDAKFFTAYNKEKTELDKLLLDWEVVQELIICSQSSFTFQSF
jgi:ATP-binding cassette subfamily F protein 3